MTLIHKFLIFTSLLKLILWFLIIVSFSFHFLILNKFSLILFRWVENSLSWKKIFSNFLQLYLGIKIFPFPFFLFLTVYYGPIYQNS